ncbi:MAG: FAD-binding molybdopterin dehydrogenase, partial [Rhizobium sp.]|nr:FAD-binding molybdopterin dehydrogenase [Rhizobium sp.]
YGSVAADPLVAERAALKRRLLALRDGKRVEVGAGKDRVIIPASVDDLAAAYEAEPGATIVAGATDVGLWVTKFMRDLGPLIFVSHLSELHRIEEGGTALKLGASVSYNEATAALVKRYPQMEQFWSRIGGEQVRNMGTIGGNIANGSPIGDMPPALIALDARVTLRSLEGVREFPLEAFFIDYGKQDRQRHEFVESISVPTLPEDAQFAVYKITKRRDEDITAVLGAFYLRLDGDNSVAEIRLAYGGMAGIPKRAANVESALLGNNWTEANVKAAAAELATDFSPLSDWRASADYRLLAARNLLTRFYLKSQGEEAELVRFAAAGGRS